MATINWTNVYRQAVAAATKSLGSAWATVAPAAQHSIQMLVDTAAYISANKEKMDSDEYQLLITNQKLAMQNVLLGYEAIGIAMAEQAVAAAWGVIENAVQSVLS